MGGTAMTATADAGADPTPWYKKTERDGRLVDVEKGASEEPAGHKVKVLVRDQVDSGGSGRARVE